MKTNLKYLILLFFTILISSIGNCQTGVRIINQTDCDLYFRFICEDGSCQSSTQYASDIHHLEGQQYQVYDNEEFCDGLDLSYVKFVFNDASLSSSYGITFHPLITQCMNLDCGGPYGYQNGSPDTGCLGQGGEIRPNWMVHLSQNDYMCTIWFRYSN